MSLTCPQPFVHRYLRHVTGPREGKITQPCFSDASASCFLKIICFFLFVSNNFPIFAASLVSPFCGRAGGLIYEKDVFERLSL